jgi:hypothetical protein
MRIDTGTIREHCKHMLAQMFHDTIKCEGPRSQHDWFAACRVIDANPYIVTAAIRRITEHCQHYDHQADPNHYGTFDHVCWRMIWENMREARESMENQSPYGKITFH